MVTNMQMKLAVTSSQTILQKGMCKQQLHYHLHTTRKTIIRTTHTILILYYNIHTD